MEKIQQVQKRNLISLAQIGAELDIKEGDYLSIEVVEGGLFLKPISWHDKSQDYFWLEENQSKLKQSLKDLEEGNFKKFNSVDEFAEFIENGIDNE